MEEIKMKVNFNQLNSLKTALEKLQPLSLPFKTKYWLAKLATSVEKNLEFYSTSLREIVNEFAAKDENGNFIYTDETQQQVRIIDGKMPECNAAFASLSEVEYEVTDLELSEEIFDGIDVDLNYAEIEALSLFFK
jgi:hypothetical protein